MSPRKHCTFRVYQETGASSQLPPSQPAHASKYISQKQFSAMHDFLEGVTLVRPILYEKSLYSPNKLFKANYKYLDRLAACSFHASPHFYALPTLPKGPGCCAVLIEYTLASSASAVIGIHMLTQSKV